jgi:hypothetical protein
MAPVIEVGRQEQLAGRETVEVADYLQITRAFARERAPTGGDEVAKKVLRESCPCGRCLLLSESQAVGRCMRCQSDEEFETSLVSLAARRDQTRQPVKARVEELRMEKEL